ncbi:hypothetical protein IM45_133 [Candidatus Palibaumannia cicadellinicola]|uniref:Uncharacterized protein n=1 Tax=Candidatus Palibaumannia cicadellinicola TaxID=186490 RepID=A0A088MXD7_9GAMM|nr:hypothetical protein IM45_133 [Candidatus Baumannia cicadellinicola]
MFGHERAALSATNSPREKKNMAFLTIIVVQIELAIPLYDVIQLFTFEGFNH